MSTEAIPLKETILGLKLKLQRDVEADIVVDPRKSDHSNRGNKLDPATETLTYRNLNSGYNRYRLADLKLENEAGNAVRSVKVYENKQVSLEEMIQREVDAKLGIEDDDLMTSEEFHDYYDGRTKEEIIDSLKLDELLRPISKPSDIITIPTIAHTYKNKHLDQLASQLIHIIEKEQDNVILLSKLMNLFLGDDPSHMLEATMGLPEYDHNLDLDKQLKQENSAQEFNIDARQTKLMERNPNADPFFVPPIYQSDPELNLDMQDADEVRQLVQIALQRNEEFVRSLCQIRKGFVRATRLKDFIYQWCTEIYEEEINGTKDILEN